MTLRLVEEADLAELYSQFCAIDNRGPYYPATILSETELERVYREDGFWSDDRGALLVIDPSGTLVGWITFFTPHPVGDALEISYLVFDEETRGKGIATEALGLMVEFLFMTKGVERLELNIVTENTASVRVAEKNGFRTEGTRRSVWYSPALGRRADGFHFALLRSEWAHAAATGPRNASSR